MPEYRLVREPIEGEPQYLIMDVQLPKVVGERVQHLEQRATLCLPRKRLKP